MFQIKKTPTVSKDDFKHLPKTERGSALRKALKKVEHDEAHDEFASYFNRERTPKVLITMSPFAKKVEHDEAHDEFASYFNRETTPKVLITMSPFAKKVGFESLGVLNCLFAAFSE
ncbi:hypothetical protein ANCCEY_10207 [Ancylostoma ceylanicum]|uniref:Uncharacterized protein n=1 Tax=Ancylostoma ceylanicum TaxID=53326 RepID=A0A0D6LL24_9BILA|nr:hypothetical protein ANCCEY_10207 [Ancylostoma ceylanicum]